MTSEIIVTGWWYLIAATGQVNQLNVTHNTPRLQLPNRTELDGDSM